MRYESSVTSLSWIPSEAVVGSTRLPFDAGVAHYDQPPPDVLGDLDELREADRFRFANHLTAWVEVDRAGRISNAGYSGGGQIGSTTVRIGGLSHVFQAVALPDIQHKPERGDGWRRFTQTAGGRTGMPAPRRVRRAPARPPGRPPPPLDLRPRRPPREQVGPHRLQGLVPQVLRHAHPVGRSGVRGPRYGRGVRPQAVAVRASDAGSGQT